MECANFKMTCAHWIAQVVFTMTIMLFFMFMIAFREGRLEVYLPLLTSSASVWMPSPGIPKKKPLVNTPGSTTPQ